MFYEIMHGYVRGLSCKPNIYEPRSTPELSVRLAPLNRFKPSSKSILLTVPRRCFICGSFLLFMLHIDVTVLSCLCLVALWSPAGKELTF